VAVVTAGAIGKSAVIKTKGGDHFAPNPAAPPNKLDVVDLRWSPGTITVHSGEKLTLVNADKFTDPHVLAISLKKDLPKSNLAPFKNKVVRMIAPVLLKDPSNPNAGFKALRANRGRPGLNEEGDALVLLPRSRGHQSTASWVVSAKPGTTLYYFCAVHFWMQGKIKVIK
jgi:hypothetical protein